MSVETYTGASVPELFRRARADLGAEAVVLSVRRDPERRGFELVAADPATARRVAPPAPRLRALAPAGPASGTGARKAARAISRAGTPRAGRPRVVALVGPTGAGKTTTLAKLAAHPEAFGAGRVGLITLDTFRVGALLEARAYAKLLRLPLQVVYEERDLDRALDRLRSCDTVLVDTPGRGPRAGEDLGVVARLLAVLRPDEVHLVFPAGPAVASARGLLEATRTWGVTHLLPTKLDEHGDEAPVSLARRFGLPVRWAADGQEIPGDLRVLELAA